MKNQALQIDTGSLRFTLVCCSICIGLNSRNKHNIFIPDLLRGSELNRRKLKHIIHILLH